MTTTTKKKYAAVGSPERKTAVNVWLTPAAQHDLVILAARAGVSRSEFVEQLIREASLARLHATTSAIVVAPARGR